MTEILLPDHCGKPQTFAPPNVTLQFSGGCSTSHSGYPSCPVSRAAGTSRSITYSPPDTQRKREFVPRAKPQPLARQEFVPTVVKAHVKREPVLSTRSTLPQAKSTGRQPSFSRFPKTQVSATPGPGAYEIGRGSTWDKAVVAHAFAAPREHLKEDNQKPGPGQYDVTDIKRTVRVSTWKLHTTQRLTGPKRFTQHLFPSAQSRPYTASDDKRAQKRACKRPATTEMYGKRDPDTILEPTPWEEALIEGLSTKQSLRIHDDQVVITPSGLPQDYDVKLLGTSAQDYQSVKKKNRLEEVMLQRLARDVRSEYRRAGELKDKSKCKTKLACILSSLEV